MQSTCLISHVNYCLILPVHASTGQHDVSNELFVQDRFCIELWSSNFDLAFVKIQGEVLCVCRTESSLRGECFEGPVCLKKCQLCLSVLAKASTY